MHGTVPISATSDGEATPFKKVDFYRKFIDSYLGANGNDNSQTTGVFSASNLRGEPYGNDVATMTVWVYPGVDPVNGDPIDLVNNTTDIVYTPLKTGQASTMSSITMERLMMRLKWLEQDSTSIIKQM